jgi:hypothetical protein
MPVYYCNVELTDTGHSGKANDPWSWADLLASGAKRTDTVNFQGILSNCNGTWFNSNMMFYSSKPALSTVTNAYVITQNSGFWFARDYMQLSNSVGVPSVSVLNSVALNFTYTDPANITYGSTNLAFTAQTGSTPPGQYGVIGSFLKVSATNATAFQWQQVVANTCMIYVTSQGLIVDANYGTNVAGGTGSQYLATPGLTYRCVVTSSDGFVYSNPITAVL